MLIQQITASWALWCLVWLQWCLCSVASEVSRSTVEGACLRLIIGCCHTVCRQSTFSALFPCHCLTCRMPCWRRPHTPQISVSCLNSVAPAPLGWQMWCPDTHATVTQWVDRSGSTHRKIVLQPMPSMTADMAVWFMSPMFPKTLTVNGKVGSWLACRGAGLVADRLDDTGWMSGQLAGSCSTLRRNRMENSECAQSTRGRACLLAGLCQAAPAPALAAHC